MHENGRSWALTPSTGAGEHACELFNPQKCFIEKNIPLRAAQPCNNKGFERKSAHVWYIRRLRDSPTLSRPVPFGPEAGPSTGSMYTSERARYSKGYRAAELCRNLAEELGSDRGEDRDRFSEELSPSSQRLPWTSHGGKGSSTQ